DHLARAAEPRIELHPVRSLLEREPERSEGVLRGVTARAPVAEDAHGVTLTPKHLDRSGPRLPSARSSGRPRRSRRWRRNHLDDAACARRLKRGCSWRRHASPGIRRAAGHRLRAAGGVLRLPDVLARQRAGEVRLLLQEGVAGEGLRRREAGADARLPARSRRGRRPRKLLTRGAASAPRTQGDACGSAQGRASVEAQPSHPRDACGSAQGRAAGEAQRSTVAVTFNRRPERSPGASSSSTRKSATCPSATGFAAPTSRARSACTSAGLTARQSSSGVAMDPASVSPLFTACAPSQTSARTRTRADGAPRFWTRPRTYISERPDRVS